MQVLWAPWRIEYILGEKEKECIFCAGDDRSRDRERLILYVGEHCIVLMNKFPYNNGHLLVAPKRHIPDLDLMNQEEAKEVFDMLKYSVSVLKKILKPDGFNVGLNLGKVAGAGIEEHLHFHIVPRWNGDTNFITVLGEVRVIPEHIRQTYEKLLPYFQDKNKRRAK
jgi:ATP adenylyltransferase